MGQITNPSLPGITVNPTDRESGPGAGGGASGNYCIFLGENAGLNNTRSELIVIGARSLAGGAIATASADGMVVIGVDVLPTSTNFAVVGTDPGPTVAIGNNIFSTGQTLGPTSSVIIGSNIGTAANNLATNIGNVLIGAGILSTGSVFAGQNMDQMVIIGTGAFRCPGANVVPGSRSVIIGPEACYNHTGNVGLTNSVYIGYRAGANVTSAANNTFIGSSCGELATAGGGNTLIGDSASKGAGNTQSNIIIGVAAAVTGTASNNVLLGNSAGVPPAYAGSNGVLIGASAGAGMPNTKNFQFILESAGRVMFYGVMDEGNLVIGNSVAAQRDLSAIGATNAVKLIAGTRGAGVVNTGGFFYVTAAGVLQWVNAAGVDQVLAGSITTVAALPAAPGVGSRAMVNNALAPAFGAAVAGGGAVVVPVYYDGAAWMVG